MYVVLTIIEMNKLLKEYFKEDIFNIFSNGYCLDYFDMLKSIYPDAILVIEKNNYHCAALINDMVYDVTGIRQKEDFYVATKTDIDFVYSFYKRMDEPDKKIIMKQVSGISKKMDNK